MVSLIFGYRKFFFWKWKGSKNMDLLDINRIAMTFSMMTDDDISLFISRCDALDPMIMDRLFDSLSEGSDAVSFTPDFSVGMQ